MTRAYTLPNSLLDKLEKIKLTRTESLRRSVEMAHKTPEVLVRSLEDRIKSKERDRGRTARVAVSFSEDTVAQLAVLTEYSQLPTEHVLRLAAEGFLRQYSSEKAVE